MLIILILSNLLLLSLAGLFFWFNRKLLNEKQNINEDLRQFKTIIKSYSEFLRKIYKMDVMYGDPVVKSLLDKTALLKEDLEEFYKIYFEEYYDENEEENP